MPRRGAAIAKFHTTEFAPLIARADYALKEALSEAVNQPPKQSPSGRIREGASLSALDRLAIYEYYSIASNKRGSLLNWFGVTD